MLNIINLYRTSPDPLVANRDLATTSGKCYFNTAFHTKYPLTLANDKIWLELISNFSDNTDKARMFRNY